MKRLEWKEASKEFKIGYIIGCVIMFFIGLISCLITFFYPIFLIPLVIPLVILRIILNKKRKMKDSKARKQLREVCKDCYIGHSIQCDSCYKIIKKSIK